MPIILIFKLKDGAINFIFFYCKDWKNKTNYNFWQEEFNKILNLYCEKNEDGAIKMSDD